MYDVTIVGGGAAGLMAAKVLSAAGKKILLLEANEILGGRIRRVEGFWGACEGGAEFIHGNLPTTFALLKEAKLTKEKVKGQFCRVEKGKWNENEEMVPYWDRLLKRLKNCEKDTNVHDFLQRFFKAKKYDDLRKQFTRYVEGYDAADTRKASIFAIRKEMEDEN
jgi:phytoene dehydrogenase-like protein